MGAAPPAWQACGDGRPGQRAVTSETANQVSVPPLMPKLPQEETFRKSTILVGNMIRPTTHGMRRHEEPESRT